MKQYPGIDNIYVMDHPLIQHKIGYIRRCDTGKRMQSEACSAARSL